jgi:hypothetical protein
MDLDVLLSAVGRLELRQLVWLCPLAFAAHVAEEAPRFTEWTRRHVNPDFTREHYLRVHAAGIFLNVGLAALLWAFAPPWLVLLCFTASITPGFCCNVFLHLGASVACRSYSPGLVTALVLYPPLYFLLLRAALREGLLTPDAAVVSFVLASILHTVEVARNTCGVDLPRKLLGGVLAAARRSA